ncbi:hypothetical protein [Bradyrhizobium sp. USDA 3315]
MPFDAAPSDPTLTPSDREHAVLATAAVTDALARVIQSNGEPIEIDFDFAEPDWPPITHISNAVVPEGRAMQFAAYR